MWSRAIAEQGRHFQGFGKPPDQSNASNTKANPVESDCKFNRGHIEDEGCNADKRRSRSRGAFIH